MAIAGLPYTILNMGLDLTNTVDVIEVMENYVESIRPPEDIRDKMDISYKIDN